MNLDPIEFDLAEALTHFHDDGYELYSLPERIFFYLTVTARFIESFSTPAFMIERVLDQKTKAPAGCCVEFVVHAHEFRIDVFQRLKLFAAEADGADAHRWLVFDADASNPSSWQGLLKAIGNVEHFYVVGAHADRLRLMWSQWLLERQRRDDERGF